MLETELGSLIRRPKLPRLGYLFKPIKKPISNYYTGGINSTTIRICHGSSDPVSTRDVSRDRKSEKAHPEVGKGKSEMTNSGMLILKRSWAVALPLSPAVCKAYSMVAV
jgi:hypothetical protein